MRRCAGVGAALGLALGAAACGVGVPGSAPAGSRAAPPPAPAPTQVSTTAPPLPTITVNGMTDVVEPSTIAFSADGGNVVTGIVWHNWGQPTATGNGIHNHQGCVPDCASGSETPEPTTLTLSELYGGQYHLLREWAPDTSGSYSLPAGGGGLPTPIGQPSYGLPPTGTNPSANNQANGHAALTACDQNISAGPGTSCPFAEAVFVAYYRYYRSYGPRGGTVDAYSTTTGRSYAMSCSVANGVVDCRGGTNAYVTFPVRAVAVYGG